MMPFDDHLEYIHGEISIQQRDRQPYTAIFDEVRNWLLRSMCHADAIFEKLYSGTFLFGSYVNRVRIIKPNEFDVFIVLQLPYEFDAVLDEDRPGFVNLDIEGTLKSLFKDPLYWDVYNKFIDLVDGRDMLRRTSFQWWIHDVIQKVFHHSLYCPPFGYSIDYQKRNVAHTLYVKYYDKTISIDFVPAIRLRKEKWMHIRRRSPFHVNYFHHFLAIPKYLPVGKKCNKNITFQLVNPEAERDILWDHQNLKVVYRLLKSLRLRFKLRRIKSYFITTIFLWKVQQETDDEYWQLPVSYIFVDMLGTLSDYFDNRVMPYFWAKNFNLLSILKPKEITEYAKILDDVWKTLKCYPSQPLLGFCRTSYYFQFPSDSESDSDSYSDSD